LPKVIILDLLYSHADGSCSITGGYVYRGTTYGNSWHKLCFFTEIIVKCVLGYLQPNNTIIYSAAEFSLKHQLPTVLVKIRWRIICWPEVQPIQVDSLKPT
jgi:hypothetical protein